MSFKLDYNVCHICDSKMSFCNAIAEFRCPNGCCRYHIDTMSPADVEIILFNNANFIFTVKLYDESFLREYMNYDEKLEKNLKRYLKEVEYWKENDRYLTELMK